MNSLLEFIQDSIIEVYNPGDFEFDNPIEKRVSGGSVIEVKVLFEDAHNYQVRLDDGLIGVIPTDFVRKCGSTVENVVDNGVDWMFEKAHEAYGTVSGDITPAQLFELGEIKYKLIRLLREQIMQNKN